MTPPARRLLKDVVAARGWKPGTALEDWAAMRLSRWGHKPGRVVQQHRIGRYRVDFAWVDLRVALEMDGWHHRSPEGAAKDAARDSELRTLGWLVLRVDDRGTEADRERQLLRVADVIHALQAAS